MTGPIVGINIRNSRTTEARQKTRRKKMTRTRTQMSKTATSNNARFPVWETSKSRAARKITSPHWTPQAGGPQDGIAAPETTQLFLGRRRSKMNCAAVICSGAPYNGAVLGDLLGVSGSFQQLGIVAAAVRRENEMRVLTPAWFVLRNEWRMWAKTKWPYKTVRQVSDSVGPERIEWELKVWLQGPFFAPAGDASTVNDDLFFKLASVFFCSVSPLFIMSSSRLPTEVAISAARLLATTPTPALVRRGQVFNMSDEEENYATAHKTIVESSSLVASASSITIDLDDSAHVSYSTVFISSYYSGVSSATTINAPDDQPPRAALQTGPPYFLFAGIVASTIVGVFTLATLALLCRRGSFGSGTLCGLRYGDARDPDWPGHSYRRETAMVERGGGTKFKAARTDSPSIQSTVPPAYTESSSRATARDRHAFATHRAASTRKPPSSFPSRRGAPSPAPSSSTSAPTLVCRALSKRAPTPGAWSTSPSAFDKAYAAGSVRSASPAMSSAETATLSSDGPRRSIQHSHPHPLAQDPFYDPGDDDDDDDDSGLHAPVPRRILSTLEEDTDVGAEGTDGGESREGGYARASTDSRASSPISSARPPTLRTTDSGSVFSHGVRISSWHTEDSHSSEVSLHRTFFLIDRTTSRIPRRPLLPSCFADLELPQLNKLYLAFAPDIEPVELHTLKRLITSPVLQYLSAQADGARHHRRALLAVLPFHRASRHISVTRKGAHSDSDLTMALPRPRPCLRQGCARKSPTSRFSRPPWCKP
ncbi:uncharacterized protein BXZ73DRAFT_76977 [Epithele typhae]|uniref:uncharacterized protein n=1 Tax=Epithele typhae TaxID=378194 RepID=UPI00200826A0|nr:uncharacterized protein BXZ73DRAFT_76977 [Epithele typhae]KAH9934490.1 hypothetical protein BXZ73DRAFT_76977 [Epithele typhae]